MEWIQLQLHLRPARCIQMCRVGPGSAFRAWGAVARSHFLLQMQLPSADATCMADWAACLSGAAATPAGAQLLIIDMLHLSRAGLAASQTVTHLAWVQAAAGLQPAKHAAPAAGAKQPAAHGIEPHRTNGVSAVQQQPASPAQPQVGRRASSQHTDGVLLLGPGVLMVAMSLPHAGTSNPDSCLLQGQMK